MLSITQTFALLELATSNARELAWAIDWWKLCYSRATTQSELAWKIYDDAIEAKEPKEFINTLFEVAMVFDNIKIDTWRKWDKAKANYLLMCN